MFFIEVHLRDHSSTDPVLLLFYPLTGSEVIWSQLLIRTPLKAYGLVLIPYHIPTGELLPTGRGKPLVTPQNTCVMT